jgi:hypothetical protein
MLTDIPDARKVRRLAPEALGSWYTLLGSFILLYALLFRYGYGCYVFQIGDYHEPTCAADPTLLSRLFPIKWQLIFVIVAPALALSAAFLALIRFVLTRPIGWTLFMVMAWGNSSLHC